MSVDDILTIKLNSNDNVATAFNNIAKGEITQHIKVENDIPKGHKIALKKRKKLTKILEEKRAKKQVKTGPVKIEKDKTIPLDQVITLDHLTNPDKK